MSNPSTISSHLKAIAAEYGDDRRMLGVALLVRGRMLADQAVRASRKNPDGTNHLKAVLAETEITNPHFKGLIEHFAEVSFEYQTRKKTWRDSVFRLLDRLFEKVGL